MKQSQQLKSELNNLNQTDIYSLLLYTLYELKDDPKYSILSSLVYILERKSLLKLCEYFGGDTITIPTITELEQLVDAMLVYKYVEFDNYTFEDALQTVGITNTETLKENYDKIKHIIETHYTKNSRTEYVRKKPY